MRVRDQLVPLILALAILTCCCTSARHRKRLRLEVACTGGAHPVLDDHARIVGCQR